MAQTNFNLGPWGLGRILAVIGLILIVVFLAIGKLQVLPEGILFLILDLAILLP